MKLRIAIGGLTVLMIAVVIGALLVVGEYAHVVDVVVNGRHHEAQRLFRGVTNVVLWVVLVYWTGISLKRSRRKIRNIKLKRKERP